MGRFEMNHNATPLVRDRVSKEFEPIPGTHLLRRQYRSYEEYLAHQAEKLPLKHDLVAEAEPEYQRIIEERFAGLDECFTGKAVLCLGARLGGEVRGFSALGALAIGIDIQPGPCNRHVLYGDFHDIQFADATFDAVFTNALDHAFDLDRICREILRVLRPGGSFYLEIGCVPPERYESLDTSDQSLVLADLGRYFDLDWSLDVHNKTSLIDWPARLHHLVRRKG